MPPASFIHEVSRSKRGYTPEEKIRLLPTPVARIFTHVFPLILTSFASHFSGRGRCFETFKGLYPLLMFVAVWHTLRKWIHPGVSVVFTTNASAGDGSVTVSPGFFSKLKTSIVDDRSMLSWADKGAWETGAAADSQAVQGRDWFRIGFEPMFVDYTKSGTWFILFSMIEVRPVYIMSGR